MADLSFCDAETFNMVEYFLDHNLESRPDKIALRFEDRAYTFAEMAEQSRRVGNVLRDLGVQPELKA